MSSNQVIMMEQGDKVFFTTDNGSQYAIGHINDIFDDVVIFQNQDGLFFVDRWLAEETTSLIEKAESQAMFAHISLVDQIKNLFAAIVA